MSFLQPLALLGLPLVALPILIHLVNQRRHRTVNWAAMMFLVSAKRMNRGMARLRHLLILLARMLAVAVLVLAVGRPLAGGWLSGVGMGKRDATLVLLDRSASMEARDLQTGESKRSTALRKLSCSTSSSVRSTPNTQRRDSSGNVPNGTIGIRPLPRRSLRRRHGPRCGPRAR